MAERFENLIAGNWEFPEANPPIESLNPADTTDVVGLVPESSPEDVDRAVKSAREAFSSWRLVPPPKRAEIIFRAAELLLKNKQSLGELVTREMGKVLKEGLGDVQEAIDMAYYMAGEGRRMAGETVPSELPNKDCKSIRVPIGVFALITPWNFPIAIPAWKILPALVAGNTVVFKPSSHTPVCATRFVEILMEAGIPAGVLNLVHGRGETTGKYLAEHPLVDGVSFTGSTKVGEAIIRSCAGIGKEVSCEMGGKNPIIIMDDADLELALEGSLWAAFGTTGQRCTAASRLIVHRRVYDTFLKEFTARTEAMRIGDGLKEDTDMGPLINEAQLERALGYVKIGTEEGATLITGGRRLTGGSFDRGYFMGPAIFTDVTPSMRIAREEIFGPVVALFRADSFEEAIELANHTDYGLSSAIYTRDVNKTALAERELNSGLVYINAPTIGAEIQLPFGGIKKSGSGHKEAGGMGGAIDMFTRIKVIYRDFSGRLQKAQIEE